MKLIHEYTLKVIITIICFMLALECVTLFYISFTSNKIFNQNYDETLKRSEDKALEVTKNIKMFTTNFLMNFVTKLKIIARYTLLYNGKNSTNYENIINKNFKLYHNNMEKMKQIIKANMTNLFMNPEFYRIYKQTGQLNELGIPTESSTLNYIQYYSQIIGNEIDKNMILNKLFREHNELNYISHHYFGNNKSYDITEDLEKVSILKNILMILKTIYIQRLITKKSGMDIIRFLIFNENELFIYPPEDYRKINLVQFRTVFPDSKCQYTNLNLSDYPSCVYDHIINVNFPSKKNYVLILREAILYQIVSGAICIKFAFNKEEPDKSFICIELDLSSLLNAINLSNAKNFEFGLFHPLSLKVSIFDFKDIFIVFDNRKDLYFELFDVFNSSETTPYAYILNKSDTTRLAKYFSLYHFLYFYTTKLIIEHPELNLNISRLEEEYIFVRDKLFEIEQEFKNDDKKEIFPFTFNKTICRKKLLSNDFECIIDEFKMMIMPLTINVNQLNEDFIETGEICSDHYDLFIYSIISTNPKTNKENINTILRIKIIRITCFYFFISFIIFCFFILFINIISEYSFESVEDIIKDINQIEIDDIKREMNDLKENKNFMANNEMNNLKNIYEIMRKSLIIKKSFSKELFLREHHLEFYNLIQDIKKKNIKEICNSFIAFFHFENDIYNISEKEFKSTINFIQDNENKLKSGETNEYDDKLKDAIKRSSTVSYLNEYSTFENIDENMMDIIYLKIFKQRFIYLYAMTKFKLGSEINSGHHSPNNPGAANKNKIKKIKEKKMNYFKDAIKYFQECHNINALLGINQIKNIYSLIMISKCYIQLNDYKNAIISINEALSLFFKFSKTFKDYHSKNYNPKVMLFVESNIFHYILFTMSRLCNTFNKPCVSNWIILKIFETSPFIFNNIHYHSCVNLINFFDRNKTKMNKYEPNFYKNANLMKEFDKIKKSLIKINSRLYIKNSNNKDKRTNTKKIGDNDYSTSNKTPTISESITDRSKISSNLKKENITSKISQAFMNKNRKLNKILTLCLSEKILEKLNGQEFKDVLIKYFQKYFISNENDKFSFIQFANNGKKTVSIKLEPLNNFLLKFQKTKGSFELTDSFKPNKEFIFMELYNILDSIIKNYPQTEETDNIIMLFIDSEDIRFTTVVDCLNIVDDLNKKNASVYFLSFEPEIKEEKVNNIQSFLNGLIEGYFFHIKNYQQLKQIFINISTIKYQTNFFGYDFQIFDHTL